MTATIRNSAKFFAGSVKSATMNTQEKRLNFFGKDNNNNFHEFDFMYNRIFFSYKSMLL